MEERTKLSKGERTQRRVLDAAKGLFLSQGYTATSMRQIAHIVGITPAAIYTHFSSKEEIFTTLLEDAAPFNSFLSLFETVQANNAEVLIARTLRSLIELFSSHEDYMRLALIDTQERDGSSLSHFLPKLFPAALSYHQRLLALGDERSRLRDISPFLFMRTLISLMGGYIMSGRVLQSMKSLQIPEADWEQGLVDIFLYGVLKTPEPGVE